MPGETAPAATFAIGPIPLEERIHTIDVLRGFALFGILAANMRGFFAPAAAYFNPKLMWTGTADRIVQGLIETLIQGKFITLFAFLFGVGFAVQLGRAEARGTRFTGFYSRRLFALFLFGVAHSLLLWWGDILFPYALGGFFLFFFRKRSTDTILRWAIALYCAPLVLAGGYLLAQALGAPIPSPPQPTTEALAQTIRVYQQGSWMEIFHKRIEELTPQIVALPFYFTRVVGIFLFGLYTWRTGFIQGIPDRLPLFRKILPWALAIGLGGNAGATWMGEMLHIDNMRPTPAGVLVWTIQSAAIPALSLFYASAVILLYHDQRWRAWMTPFSAVGRTALTNYLLQSVIGTTLFYSFGFALYGKIGPALALIPTLIIYPLQIPLSAWWLGRFRFGPLEWLWRSLTYGRLQPMRQSPRQPPVPDPA